MCRVLRQVSTAPRWLQATPGRARSGRCGSVIPSPLPEAVGLGYPITHEWSECLAAEDGAPAGNDVGVDDSVPVAVERPVVDHHVLVASQRVGAGRDVKDESDIAGVAMEIVADEEAGAYPPQESPGDAGPGELVVADHRRSTS